MSAGIEEGCDTPPKYRRDDGSQQMAERRKRFEHWYAINAFDYERDPIGSERCDIQWQAWLGAEKSAARITGMRMINGVHVIVSQPSSDLLEEQLLVRYEDYIKLVAQLGASHDIHTCSYHCDRPACIRAQCDELAAKFAGLNGAALAHRKEVLQDYVADYEFMGETEDGRDAIYQPNDRERLLIEDAIRGWDALDLPHSSTSPAPPAGERVAVNVEAMLAACVPGGSICDPQQVADSIREWFAVFASQPPGSGEVPNG